MSLLSMDVLDENETLQLFFAIESPEELNFEQLEQFITEGETEFALQGALPQDGAPGGQHLNPPTSQPPNNSPALTNPQPSSRPVVSKAADVPITHTQIVYDDTQYSARLPHGQLPDSPPDSGSEPCSPPETKAATLQGSPGVTSPFLNHSPVHQLNPLLDPQQGMVTLDPGVDDMFQLSNYLSSNDAIIDLSCIPTMAAQQGDLEGVLQQASLTERLQGVQVPGGLALGRVPGASTEGFAGGVVNIPLDVLQVQALGDKQAGLQLANFSQPELQRQESLLEHQNKKRKHSLTPDNSIRRQSSQSPPQIEIKKEPGTESSVSDMDLENAALCIDQEYEYAGGDGMAYTDTPYQFIKWLPYQTNKWHTLVDAAGQELPPITYRVEADKGFNFSVVDDAFVCQKKNHFQITTHVGITGQAMYVKTDSGLKTVDNYHIHLHGIKVEAHNSYIRVEQSQANRSKRPFQPVRIDVHPGEITKVTTGRLHYSETTSNNMRKKGKPNPDQRFFMLVVSIHAHSGEQNYMLAAHVSERIIVRASNPGQFESDVDVMWQRGQTPDSIYHLGRLGINTDRPDEALVVQGNIRLTGHIMQPSDIRAKENIEEVDSREQLKNIGKMRIYRYNYTPEFAEQAGLPECDQVETGVIAQEMQDVIPDAVTETGDVYLSNGDSIDNFLTVNKDRIYMENIGAVKELCRLTDNIETRLDELEKINRRLAKLKRLDSFKSISSSGSFSRTGSHRSGGGGLRKCKEHHGVEKGKTEEEEPCLSLRAMRIIIILLICIMLFCIGSMVGLYLLNLQETSSSNPTGQSTSSFLPGENISRTNGSDVVNTDMPFTTPIHQDNPFQGATSDDDNDCGVGCQMFCCSPLEITKSASYSSQISTSDYSQSDGSSDTTEENPGRAFMGEETELQDRVKRGKRDNTMDNNILPTLTVSSVMVDGLNIMNNTKCVEPCGLDTNYTYKISVPPYVPLTDMQIEINTTISTTVWKCIPYLFNICPDAFLSPPDVINSIEGMVHRWSIPIGKFVSSSYKFRVSSLQGVQDTICGSTLLLGTDFIEYNFIFTRNRTMCKSR